MGSPTTGQVEEKLKGLIAQFTSDLEYERSLVIRRVNTIATDGVELLKEYIQRLEARLAAKELEIAGLHRQIVDLSMGAVILGKGADPSEVFKVSQ